MKGLRLVLATFAVGVVGCSLPMLGNGPFGARFSETDAAVDPSEVPRPIVQVRDFPHSFEASVVAWERDETQIGLRTSITRSGKLFGGLRAGDHQLYMEPLQARIMGGFKYATVDSGQILLGIGARRDSQACQYGRTCSPMVVLGVRIPDATLRAHRDSLVVTFYPAVAHPWSVSLRPELVTAYLEKVDSVVASRR